MTQNKHNRRRALLAIPLLVITLLALAVGCPDDLNAVDRIPVCVSIVPQAYFVQQIGMDMVNIQVMVPPGASPETYEPRPAQMKDLGDARLYFSLGVPFETVWLNKIVSMNPDIKIVRTDKGIQKRTMEAHACGESSRDLHHHHDSVSIPENSADPHIWLSPALVMSQAGMILRGLQEADPDRREAYEKNYRTFMLRLQDLDTLLKQLFADSRGSRFMVLHPAWGYFADDYGLIQIPVEVEGKAPKPAQLKQIIDFARQHSLNVMLVQPQSTANWVKQVADAIHGQVVYADPLAPDWEKNLTDVAAKIKTALR
ncbi:MAG: zinc ABC transporter substrate-binding protein [Thermodesulfobacteriota bacterium]